MVLVLRYYNLQEDRLLKKAGYKYVKQANGWIRKELSGRFHIKKLGRGVYNIHYDLIIKGRPHFAPPMPIAIGEEIKRIVKVLRVHERQLKQKNSNISRLIKQYRGVTAL